jgi:hypothetical protein
MRQVEDGFLVNRSYTQHMLLTIGLAIIYLFITGLMVYAYFMIMTDVDPSRKALTMIGGIVLATLIFGPIVAWFILKLRNTPTHLDISKERVVLRYQWGEASFSLEELFCFIGSEDWHFFSSKMYGAVLKDGSEVEMFIMDDEFVEDMFALARKNKIRIEADWKAAREQLGNT